MNVSPEGAGSIEICDLGMDLSKPVSFVTYNDGTGTKIYYTIDIKAVASPGYKFSKWQEDLSSYPSATVSYQFKPADYGGEVKATAVFVPIEPVKKSLSQARDLVNSEKDVLVIDVSSSDKFSNAHMICAKNYPWNTSTKDFTPNSISALDNYNNQDVLVYDYYGTNSKAAAEYLITQGFNSVYYMSDGLEDWIASNYETFTTDEDKDVCTSLAPIAYAGPDKTAKPNETVTLSGQGWDSGGEPVTYSWTQIEGADVTWPSGKAIAQPIIKMPKITGVDESLVFRLTVTNNKGEKDSDCATVTVNVDNQPPTADAGPDQTVKPGELVTLDGSGSSDSDGMITGYHWTQTGGLSVKLSDDTAKKPIFTAPAVSTEPTLTFKLVVTDNGGETDDDTMNITVTASSSDSGGGGGGGGCFISTFNY